MKSNWHKIWYGFVIGLSAIVILLSVVCFIGIWMVQRPISVLSGAVLDSASNSAGAVLSIIIDIDQNLKDIQSIARDASISADQLGQSITEKGMLMVLLPKEKEQKLIELSASAESTFTTVRGMISNATALYLAIDNLPFIDLPIPDQAEMEGAGQALARIHDSVDELKNNSAQFRAGVIESTDWLQGSSDLVSQQIGAFRSRLSTLKGQLTDLQTRLEKLHRMIGSALMLGSITISVFLVFVVYSQVEFIRLFLRRWRSASARM